MNRARGTGRDYDDAITKGARMFRAVSRDATVRFGYPPIINDEAIERDDFQLGRFRLDLV